MRMSNYVYVSVKSANFEMYQNKTVIGSLLKKNVIQFLISKRPASLKKIQIHGTALRNHMRIVFEEMSGFLI